jgi:hypothetical protein
VEKQQLTQLQQVASAEMEKLVERVPAALGEMVEQVPELQVVRKIQVLESLQIFQAHHLNMEAVETEITEVLPE